ncbi:MAG TPA: hypothetical protein VFV43_01585 [Limnobacter sp.]|nr:hypothetical protein [Limnobacter sp.]
MFSDYPIKQMGYARFFKSLGHDNLVLMNTYPNADMKTYMNAELVVFDMNISAESENRHLQSVMRAFKKAHVLFMEELHADLHYQLIHGRDICCLGKLAEVKVMHACLKDMLLRCKENQKPKPRERSKTDKPDTEMA